MQAGSTRGITAPGPFTNTPALLLYVPRINHPAVCPLSNVPFALKTTIPIQNKFRNNFIFFPYFLLDHNTLSGYGRLLNQDLSHRRRLSTKRVFKSPELVRYLPHSVPGIYVIGKLLKQYRHQTPNRVRLINLNDLLDILGN